MDAVAATTVDLAAQVRVSGRAIGLVAVVTANTPAAIK